jgi:hypothetical protein
MPDNPQAPTTREDLIVLVHGTFAGRETDDGDSWWQRGSPTWDELQKRLPSGTRLAEQGEVFHWSGENSERARIKAAQQLLTHLLELESRGQSYHVMGHSHGGSVIWHALKSAELRRRPLEHLRSWATIGTPFMHHRTHSAWSVRNVIHIVLAILLLRPAYNAFLKLAGLVGSALVGINSGVILPAKEEVGWVAVVRTPIFKVLELLRVPVTQLDGGQIRLGSYDPASGESFARYLFGTYEGWVILTVTLVCVYLFVNVAGFLLSPVIESLRIRSEKRLERSAMNAYGAKWLGLWSTEDEAINGLRATLDLSVSFVARMAPREMVLSSDKLSLLSRPYLWVFSPVFNAVVRPFLDGVVRSFVVKTAQGNNRPAAEVVAVSVAPVLQETQDGIPPIPDWLNTKIVAEANANASGIAAELRKLLAQPSFVGGLEGFGNAISGRELVHTSYFDHPEILDLLTMHMAWAASDNEFFDRLSPPQRSLATWLRQFKQRLGGASNLPLPTEPGTTDHRPRRRPRRVAA